MRRLVPSRYRSHSAARRHATERLVHVGPRPGSTCPGNASCNAVHVSSLSHDTRNWVSEAKRRRGLRVRPHGPQSALVVGGQQGPSPQPPPPRDAVGREGTPEAAPEAVRQAVGGGCQSGWGAVTVGYMPLKLGRGVRGTVTGHRLGALEGGVASPPFQGIPPPPPPKRAHCTGPRIRTAQAQAIRLVIFRYHPPEEIGPLGGPLKRR